MLQDVRRGDGSIPLALLEGRATTFRMSDPHSLYRVNDPVGKSTAQVGRVHNSP